MIEFMGTDFINSWEIGAQIHVGTVKKLGCAMKRREKRVLPYHKGDFWPTFTMYEIREISIPIAWR